MSDAQTRIRTAELDAIDVLLTRARAAWIPFLTASEGPARGAGTRAQRLTALNSALRVYRNGKMEAYRLLFDAVAAEYRNVDTDPESYSERLERVVIPIVRHSLPVRADERVPVKVFVAWSIEWETRLFGTRPAVSRAAAAGDETPSQVIDRSRRQKGWTMEQVAAGAGLDIKQVYRVKRSEPVRTDTIVKLAAVLECQPGDLISTPPLKSQR